MATLLSRFTHQLSHAGIGSAAMEARLLLAHVLQCSVEALIADPNPELTAVQRQKLTHLIARRLAHEPMSHLLGFKEFYGLGFEVSANVLTPRPDSETVIAAVLAELEDREKPYNIMDMGTGSGCLLLTLLHHLSHAWGLGVDRSLAALSIAQNNANRLKLADRACFVQANWAAGLRGKYEIVVANPPYIPSNAIRSLMPEVAEYEPHQALDGGDDGLHCYRILAKQLPPLLADGAMLVLEIGEGQAVAVADLFCQAGLRHLHTNADLAGIARAVVLQAPEKD